MYFGASILISSPKLLKKPPFLTVLPRGTKGTSRPERGCRRGVMPLILLGLMRTQLNIRFRWLIGSGSLSCLSAKHLRCG
jgi:hypothetical protein